MVPVSIVCCGGEITGVEIMWHWSMVGVWDGPGLSDKSGWQSDLKLNEFKKFNYNHTSDTLGHEVVWL